MPCTPGSTGVAIPATSVYEVHLVGGNKIDNADGADNLRFDYRGSLLGQLRLEMRGGRSNDVIQGSAATNPGSVGTASGVLNGQFGTDVVTWALTGPAVNSVQVIQ